MATGYLKVNVRTVNDLTLVQPLDGGAEFYADPAYLTLTKDIVDLLDKEMSEDKALLFLMTEAQEVQAIQISWIEAYADWLTTIPAPFAANDEKSIRAMLAKWKTNPDLPKPECSEDACDL